MIHQPNLKGSSTFDPSDWQQFGQLAHQMLDTMLDYLQHIRQQPVWQKPPQAVRQHFQQSLPLEGQSLESVYQEFLTYILPYPKGNIHPRFFAWVQTTGTPLGMLAEMLSAGMTPNVTIGDHAAMYVDGQVVEWCKQLLNFPLQGSALLVSGGSMANLTGLLVARHSVDRERIRRKGILATGKQLLLYASTETHSCIQKAAEVMGLGTDALRKVPVDAHYRMDMEQLKRMLAQDWASGLHPFCVVGSAGTVNTGAIDPLNELADLCEQYGLWFHVDGAFGALAKVVPAYQTQLAALERANSVAFDLHKWLSLPYEVGCVLVKDAALHRETFALTPNYLLSHERGLAAGPDQMSNYGIELSRGFKALKVWMSLKTFGVEHLASIISQNIEQMAYLSRRVQEEPLLELLAPTTLNIVCYRYNPGGLSTEALNQLNREILMQLQERAIASPSYTMLKGQYAIRAANVNHRTKQEDLDALLEGTLSIGNQLLTC
jgi:glutamate/tyrosine decarboxylase-like PLP-dependent enzyme